MYYHIALTDECNLRCSYCRGQIGYDPVSCEKNNLPSDFSVETGSLCSFLEHDPDAVVIFYGGEPLLRADLIEEFVEILPVKRFMLHTNGILLDRLNSDTLGALEKIQVSIDGRKKVTDTNRGSGTYEQIIKNLEKILDEGFTGEIAARMTVVHGTRIMDEVLHLDSLPFFSSVHWQLNAMFYDDYSPEFAVWAKNDYIPSLHLLACDWVEIMKNEGRVPRWYPLLAPVNDMLAGRRERGLRCGCGIENYTIAIDGSISPCPCMHGFEGINLGHINESIPAELPKIRISDPCDSCDIMGFCGGRCLYAHYASLWPEEGRIAVCSTVRGLKESLDAVLPEIRELISNGTIKKEDFGFEHYWGCEVIP